MTTNGQLGQRIDDLVRGVLEGAREIALAAVAEAFARNEGQLLGEGGRDSRRAKKEQRRGHGDRARRLGKKRSPEEMASLGEKLCKAICRKPGETMTYYAEQVSSTPAKLNVPVRRLMEEGRVRGVGDRSQRKYYAGARE